MQIGPLAFTPPRVLVARPQAAPSPDSYSPGLVASTRKLTAEGLPQRVRSVPLGNLMNEPYRDSQGRIQLIGRDGWLALDPTTLEPVASQTLPSRADGESILVGDRLVYSREEGAGLTVLENGLPTRELAMDPPLSGQFLATPEGGVLLGNRGGQILSLDPATGQVTPRFQLPGEPGEKNVPLRLAPASDGGLYVQTRDERVVRFDPDGQVRWDRPFTMHLSWHPPVESLDGKQLYLGGVSRALVALDADSGEERWRHTFVAEWGLGASGLAPVLQDSQGNVYAAANQINPERENEWPPREPTIHLFKLSPKGKLLYRVDTDIDPALGKGLGTDLALDNQGNLCATAAGRLIVVSPVGRTLARVEPEEPINSFLLNPEKDRLLLVCGEYSGWDPKPYSLVEVDLPGRPVPRDAAESGSVRETPGAVQVGGVRVRKRRAAL